MYFSKELEYRKVCNMEYLHGGDIYRNQAEYDFSVNINPLGMPLGSIQAAHEGIVLVGRYPDYKCESLCQAIASSHSISPEYVLVGNGAAELIYNLCYAVNPRKALTIAPTFQEYEKAVNAAGGEMEYYYLKEENNFDLQYEFVTELFGRVGDLDMVFLCNPNNPTGRVIRKDILLKVLQTCQDREVYLCVDESFLPFLENEDNYSMIDYLESYDKLIILRSFTKIYGMPGLRLGYALSSNIKLIENMREKCQPWSVSTPAQLAGISALKDVDFLEKTKRMIQGEREYLVRELMPIIAEKYYISYANFILFKGGADLKVRLLEEGVLIRDCSNFKGLGQGYYRMAVRSTSENKELVRRVSKWQR
ncbi:MAG: aminotransferase class I/II-fold pyridoxal phosphate-dependent enzyme [Lachnospiraceae bacterium]|nr:aminotransferase class I/II-fold pyridoxal phosphate-dependent enzyme [Lachnospiraceae bacterium]